MVTDSIGLATAERFIVEDVEHVFITERRQQALDGALKKIGANNVTAVHGDISNMNDLDIHSKYLHQILKSLIDLPQLHSLILSPIDSISNPNVLLMEIFSLKHLKSCQLTYRMKMNETILPIDFELTEQSPIEYLTINGPFRYESFQKLFIYLPKLRHLSINYLLGSNRDFQINFSPIELKDLKYSLCVP